MSALPKTIAPKPISHRGKRDEDFPEQVPMSIDGNKTFEKQLSSCKKRNTNPIKLSELSGDKDVEMKDESLRSRIWFSKADGSKNISNWQTLVLNDIKEQEHNPFHYLRYENDEKIADAQRQVYSFLGKKKMPHNPEDIMDLNMLFAEKYPRAYEGFREPISVEVISKTEIPTYMITERNLTDLFKYGSCESTAEPLKALIQQHGAGKTFEMYNLSRTNYILFFNMSSQKKDKQNTSAARQTIVPNLCVSCYYNAVKEILKNAPTASAQFERTVCLTSKLVYAAIFHLYVWKQVCRGNKYGPQDWFNYSLISSSTLERIFVTLWKYKVASIREAIFSLKWPDDLDIRSFVMCFDDANELTTPEITEGRLFVGDFRVKNPNPERPLFYPFLTSLIVLCNLGIYRLVSGTTLSLSRMFPSRKSVLRDDEVSLLSLRDLSNTTLQEIKDQIVTYFPGLRLNDKNLEKLVGRSRYFYDIFLPELFRLSKDIGTSTTPLSEKLTQFQSNAEAMLETCINQTIVLFANYIRNYKESGIIDDTDDKEIAQRILNDVLRDIASGGVTSHMVTSDECTTFLDCGLLRFVNARSDGEITLGQQEYSGSMGVQYYYENYSNRSQESRLHSRSDTTDCAI